MAHFILADVTRGVSTSALWSFRSTLQFCPYLNTIPSVSSFKRRLHFGFFSYIHRFVRQDTITRLKAVNPFWFTQGSPLYVNQSTWLVERGQWKLVGLEANRTQCDRLTESSYSQKEKKKEGYYVTKTYLWLNMETFQITTHSQGCFSILEKKS